MSIAVSGFNIFGQRVLLPRGTAAGSLYRRTSLGYNPALALSRAGREIPFSRAILGESTLVLPLESPSRHGPV